MSRYQTVRQTSRRWFAGASVVGRQCMHLVVAFFLLGVGAIALVMGLTLLQGQRDESRRVDALVLVPTTIVSEGYTQSAFELYRRGYAPLVVLTGSGQERLRDALVERGLPETALVLTEQGATSHEDLQFVAVAAQQAGAETVLVASEPAQLLLDLKMLRDFGLAAYGTSLAASPPDLPTLVQSSLDYWAYVLAGG